jgi:hypothetical protein
MYGLKRPCRQRDYFGMGGSLLRKRDVRLIVGAVGISSIGDFLLWVPLTLYRAAKARPEFEAPAREPA